MKKLFLMMALFLAFLPGCTWDIWQEDVKEQGYTFAPVRVNLGVEDVESNDPDTRSLVSIDGVEKFVKAALFAFDSEGKIIVAGDENSQRPVAVSTIQSAFEWLLPLNADLTVYVIENYGDLDLSPYLNNVNLTVNDLKALTFSCTSSEELAKLDSKGLGLPMSGINQFRIDSQDDVLNIKVGKLFARYNFSLDLTAFRSDGWEVNFSSVRAANSNTEVPWFYDATSTDKGFKQTDHGKIKVIDRNSNTDLQLLDDGDAVTYYFLENCQGTLKVNGTVTPESWKTIYSEYEAAGDLDRIANCSYLEFTITASKEGYGTRNFVQRVYLGDDFASDNRTNFNVRRNVMQTARVILRPNIPATEAFEFDHARTYVAEAGDELTFYFGWNGCPLDQIGVQYDETILKDPKWDEDNAPVTVNGKSFNHSGRVTFTAQNLSSTAITSVKGGHNLDSDAEVSDETQAAVQKTHVFEDIRVRCEVISDGVTYNGTGNDMEVSVALNNGNNRYLKVSCDVKYDGVWHNDIQAVPEDSNPDPRIALHDFDGIVSSAYAKTSRWNVTDVLWMMPGDTEDLYIFFNDDIVASWQITYGNSGSSPGPEIQDWEIACQATVNNASYSLPNVFTSEGTATEPSMDMVITVNDVTGNPVTFAVSGRVKYNGSWHTIGSDSHLSLKMGTTAKPFNFTTTSNIVGGSEVVLSLYVDAYLVKKWTVVAVNISNQIITDLQCTITCGGESFTGDCTEDMYIEIDEDEDITVTITGRIFYNGAWHNISSDSNIKCRVEGYSGYRWTWTNQYASGDTEEVTIYVGDKIATSFTIEYE